MWLTEVVAAHRSMSELLNKVCARTVPVTDRMLKSDTHAHAFLCALFWRCPCCSVLTAVAAETQGNNTAVGEPSSSGRRLLQFSYYDDCDYYGNCGSSLSGGGIAGIVIGCVLLLCSVICLILRIMMRRRRMARDQVTLPHARQRCLAIFLKSGLSSAQHCAFREVWRIRSAWPL